MNQIPYFKTKEEIEDFNCNSFPYFWGEMYNFDYKTQSDKNSCILKVIDLDFKMPNLDFKSIIDTNKYAREPKLTKNELLFGFPEAKLFYVWQLTGD